MATAREWSERVTAWQASGETAAAFAEREELNLASLRWWASRLKREPLPPALLSSPEVGFVEVVTPSTVRAPTSSAPAIDVLLGGGRWVRVAQGFDRDHLRAVVETLEAE